MQEDLLDTLSKFVIKLLAGFELTSLFLFSLGTNYPPIDEDVTFWCVKPYVCMNVVCRVYVCLPSA